MKNNIKQIGRQKFANKMLYKMLLYRRQILHQSRQCKLYYPQKITIDCQDSD